MAYLHELRRDIEHLVVNSHGNFYVQTPSGTLFYSFDTDDLAQMALACGSVFNDDWRAATDSEFIQWDSDRIMRQEHLLHLQWSVPQPRPTRPHLKLVKG